MSRGGNHNNYGAVREYRDDPNYQDYEDSPGKAVLLFDQVYRFSFQITSCLDQLQIHKLYLSQELSAKFPKIILPV